MPATPARFVLMDTDPEGHMLFWAQIGDREVAVSGSGRKWHASRGHYAPACRARLTPWHPLFRWPLEGGSTPWTSPEPWWDACSPMTGGRLPAGCLNSPADWAAADVFEDPASAAAALDAVGVVREWAAAESWHRMVIHQARRQPRPVYARTAPLPPPGFTLSTNFNSGWWRFYADLADSYGRTGQAAVVGAGRRWETAVYYDGSDAVSRPSGPRNTPEAAASVFTGAPFYRLYGWRRAARQRAEHGGRIPLLDRGTEVFWLDTDDYYELTRPPQTRRAPALSL